MSHLSLDSLSWNNFAESLGKLSKKRHKITEMSYEEFVKEREKGWGDPAEAFDMSNTSAPHEDCHLASDIAAAAVELATGGNQIAPSSGGGGNDDEWWERERQRAKQNEYQPRRKGRH